LLPGTTLDLLDPYSDSKKYRQETLMSKVESEPSVIFKLLVVRMIALRACENAANEQDDDQWIQR
jgi:hypothetical protein